MLPSGLIAAALLLSLIPGWWFLRRTESCRRPRKYSSLQEVLELVGVGVFTTGVGVSAGLLIRPQLVLDHSFPPDTPNEIRLDVVLTLGSLVVATGLAEIGARVFRRVYPPDNSEFNMGPWWSVLSRSNVPAGQVPYVAMSVADGLTIEGVLHNFTLYPDETHRDIALRSPITLTRPTANGGKPKVTKTSYDYVVVPASEIKHIAVQHIPNVGKPTS